MNEIRATVAELRAVRNWFDIESDCDLMEACIYKLESLEARYRYLLKQAKERGLFCDAITGEIIDKKKLCS